MSTCIYRGNKRIIKRSQSQVILQGFFFCNVQNNIQMLNFYTDLNAIFIKIYTHKYNTAIV